jgi:hypothetical protein
MDNKLSSRKERGHNYISYKYVTVSSEKQQTWHIYCPRDKNSETGFKILILPPAAQLRAPQN